MSDEPPIRCTQPQRDALAKLEKHLRELAAMVPADARTCAATNARLYELNAILREADVVPADTVVDPLRPMKSLSRNQLVAMAHALRLQTGLMPRNQLMRMIYAEIAATTKPDDRGDSVA